MALTVEDAMTAPDVVGADMTVAADTGDEAIAVAMTVVMTVENVVVTPQTHTHSVLTNALTKTLLTALNPA